MYTKFERSSQDSIEQVNCRRKVNVKLLVDEINFFVEL